MGVGNAPPIPALQAAMTSSGPETRNMGAAMTGSRMDWGKAELMLELFLQDGRADPV